MSLTTNDTLKVWVCAWVPANVTVPRVLSEPLGGSKLSQAMQRGGIPGLVRLLEATPGRWRDAALATQRRFNGTDWLTRLAPAFGEAANLPSLQRAAPDGIVVTTGQQAGLFGGHMLTLVKALSARALASTIEQATGIACATVFWAATDDADFLEASSVMIPGSGEGRVLTLSQAPPPGTPMSRAPIVDIEPLLKAMEACCGSSGDEAMQTLRRAYRDGVTVGDAYVHYLRDILSPLGIAVLDAAHPAVMQAGQRLLNQALTSARVIEERALGWEQSLTKAGFRPQVESVAGLSLVFATENGIKRRIPVTESSMFAETEATLSPTVLLRPVLEASIMPTVAYTGGPGEVAYFAQLPPIADILGVPTPTVVPRWSTTIVEDGIDKILNRYSIAVDDLRDVDRLLVRLVHGRMPDDLSRPLRDLRIGVDHASAALMGASRTTGIDPRIIDGIKAQLALRLDRAERRIVAALKHREKELRRDLGTARASLYPNGARQERRLSFVPFLARYDGALLDRMLSEASGHAAEIVGLVKAGPPVTVISPT